MMNTAEKPQLTIPSVIGSAYRHGKVFRCQNCGKFISYKEIEDGKIKVDYTPDTEYTVECTEFVHLHCL